MTGSTDWIRARGLSRERLGTYLADYLTELGYAVERTELAEENATEIAGALKRMNPAVPSSLRTLRIRFTPTSGGAAGAWEEPSRLEASERSQVDRFLAELILHLERTVRTESHGTAKLAVVSGSALPWEIAPASPAVGLPNPAAPVRR
jgi:hypothetical protein